MSVGVDGAVDLCFDKLKARLRQECGVGSFSVDADAQIVFIDATGDAVPTSS